MDVRTVIGQRWEGRRSFASFVFRTKPTSELFQVTADRSAQTAEHAAVSPIWGGSLSASPVEWSSGVSEVP